MPQLRAMLQHALDIDAMDLDSTATENSTKLDASLAGSLFPLAEMRDMAYEALKTLRQLHQDLGALVRSMLDKGMAVPSLKYAVGCSDLFFITKDGIFKFEMWEARLYFLNVVGELREVKEDMRKMEVEVRQREREEVTVGVVAVEQAELDLD